MNFPECQNLKNRRDVIRAKHYTQTGMKPKSRHVSAVYFQSREDFNAVKAAAAQVGISIEWDETQDCHMAERAQ